MSNLPVVSNPTKVDLQVQAAELAPTKILAPADHDAAIAVALLLDLRTTATALRTVMKRQADGSDYFKGHYDLDNIDSILNRLIGERVG